MTQLKDVIKHYIGCDIMHTNKNGSFVLRFVTLDIQSDIVMCINPVAGAQWSYKIDDIKPILRKLSDMTEGELDECVRLIWSEESRDILDPVIDKVVRQVEVKDTVNYGTAVRYKAYDKDGSVVVMSAIRPDMLNPQQFAYLLSIGIDIFNLIPTNQAVEK